MAIHISLRREALQKKATTLTRDFQEQLPKEFLYSLESILQDMIIDSNEIDETKVEKSDIKELIIEMREGFRRMDERFEQVDKRFEMVDKRFEEVNKRFEEVNKRFEEVNKRIDRLMIWSFGAIMSATTIIIAAMKYSQ